MTTRSAVRRGAADDGEGSGNARRLECLPGVAVENQVDVGQEEVHACPQNLADGQHLSFGDQPVRRRPVAGLDRRLFGEAHGCDVDRGDGKRLEEQMKPGVLSDDDVVTSSELGRLAEVVDAAKRTGSDGSSAREPCHQSER